MKKWGALFLVMGLLMFVISACGNSSTTEVAKKDDAATSSNKSYLVDPLSITFNKVELIHEENATDEIKAETGINEDDFYYLNIDYDVENNSSDMYAWQDFTTAIIDGEQVELDDKSINFGEVKSYQIEPNSTVKSNTIKIKASKDTKKVELIPTEPLKNNTFSGEEEEFVPDNIVLNLK
ncbi:hypothetical protein HCA99_00230 [Listeria booriae]|uniref:hypothetical protein n=1 Tax=Listeria booriae TaxID=1552123 RepID=UPI001627133F|nr:hypothetical protein [Listeria booriae]MBC2077633.1 hypothetical protein [Listeria booriae]